MSALTETRMSYGEALLSLGEQRTDIVALDADLYNSTYLQLAYQDVPRPQIGADEVLVRVHACGICGSDIHGLDGSSGR